MEPLPLAPDPEVTPMARRLLALAAAGALLAGCGTSGHPVNPDVAGPTATAGSELCPQPIATGGEATRKPTWSQDFCRMPDGPIDTSVWHFELNSEVPGYNEEEQAYTSDPRNVRIENGLLVIEAHRQPYTYPDDPDHKYEITSGRIDTSESLSFEYGTFEVTMKLPKGKGTWPAFWFLSANQPYTDRLHPTEKDWDEDRFYMHDGELDAMEAYGNTPGVVEATVHTFAESHEGRVAVPDAADAFHTYGVEITPTHVTWTIDGKPYYRFNKPSDNPDEWPFGNGNRFYPILNLAMGGNGGGPIDPNMNDWRMEVKNANFYDYSGQK